MAWHTNYWTDWLQQNKKKNSLTEPKSETVMNKSVWISIWNKWELEWKTQCMLLDVGCKWSNREHIEAPVRWCANLKWSWMKSFRHVTDGQLAKQTKIPTKQTWSFEFHKLKGWHKKVTRHTDEKLQPPTLSKNEIGTGRKKQDHRRCRSNEETCAKLREEKMAIICGEHAKERQDGTARSKKIHRIQILMRLQSNPRTRSINGMYIFCQEHLPHLFHLTILSVSTAEHRSLTSMRRARCNRPSPTSLPRSSATNVATARSSKTDRSFVVIISRGDGWWWRRRGVWGIWLNRIFVCLCEKKM